MQLFKINKKISIACESSSTRNGFKHEAVLLLNGREMDRAKCNYINRTWEQFTYQSVLNKLVEKTDMLDEKEKKLATKVIKSYGY